MNPILWGQEVDAILLFLGGGFINKGKEYKIINAKVGKKWTFVLKMNKGFIKLQHLKSWQIKIIKIQKKA